MGGFIYLLVPTGEHKYKAVCICLKITEKSWVKYAIAPPFRMGNKNLNIVFFAQKTVFFIFQHW